MSHFIGIMEVFNIGLRGQKVTTDNRLGEIRKNTFGTEMKIIAYRKNDDIDIQFLDDNGYVYEHQTYSNFKTGQIKNPYDRTIFGVGYIGVGKYKTGLQIAAIAFLLADLFPGGTLLLWCATIVTIYSGYEYTKQYYKS